ncbi:daunorubicin/doxorubicin resistance ATP-binding protein DrrA [Peptococcaceae bacterium CEB3]|nr:daunorubicin/doxorubicin resistance ATP-binding protein DrrA [Peptococcaceae bacterium CEB3]
MRPIIETKSLSKRYGSANVVKGVSLNVNKGEIYGFLGLNGAGKTTTIRMLLRMIKPTMGLAFLNGPSIC